MDRAGRREQHTAYSGKQELVFDAEIRGALFQLIDAVTKQIRPWPGTRGWRLPMGIGDARPPPVTVRIELLPQHPNLAGAIGQQVLTRKAHRHGKSFCAFANEHDMSRMLHNGLGNHRNILYVPHTTHGTSPPSRPV